MQDDTSASFFDFSLTDILPQLAKHTAAMRSFVRSAFTRGNLLAVIMYSAIWTVSPFNNKNHKLSWAWPSSATAKTNLSPA